MQCECGLHLLIESESGCACESGISRSLQCECGLHLLIECESGCVCESGTSRSMQCECGIHLLMLCECGVGVFFFVLGVAVASPNAASVASASPQ